MRFRNSVTITLLLIKLGLNINRTERILIRLRYHTDSRQFLPIEQVTDTLLHELSHIVWGPHDHNFNNLWNELRDEHQSLLAKGYTGEGFLGNGKKVGGKRVPLEEMRRQARLAAEKRKASKNANAGGHRLGGSKAVRGIDMRKVIADAATRRNSITTGCASGSREAGTLNNQAVQGGFRTKAEEDDANDLAIAQALQQLMEEEEMAKLCAPSGEGGLAWDREKGLLFDSDPPSRDPSPHTPSPISGNVTGELFPPYNFKTSSSRDAPSDPTPTNSKGQPLSRLVTEFSNTRSKSKSRAPPPRSASGSSIDRNKALPAPPTPNNQENFSPFSPPSTITPVSSDPTKWVCPQCTLLNPLKFLACDACGLEQPPQPIPLNQRYGSTQHASPLPKPPPAVELRGPAATPFEPAKGRIGWNCLNCGTFMEKQWWTCSLCGVMKDAS